MPTPRQSLTAAMREYARGRANVERQEARITAKRDKAIRKAHAAGMSQREIAKHIGLSFQRVSQIIRGTRV